MLPPLVLLIVAPLFRPNGPAVPRACALLMLRVQLLLVSPPLKVFAPLRVSVPVPVKLRLLTPVPFWLIAPLIVSEEPLARVKVRLPPGLPKMICIGMLIVCGFRELLNREPFRPYSAVAAWLMTNDPA